MMERSPIRQSERRYCCFEFQPLISPEMSACDKASKPRISCSNRTFPNLNLRLTEACLPTCCIFETIRFVLPSNIALAPRKNSSHLIGSSYKDNRKCESRSIHCAPLSQEDSVVGGFVCPTLEDGAAGDWW